MREVHEEKLHDEARRNTVLRRLVEMVQRRVGCDTERCGGGVMADFGKVMEDVDRYGKLLIAQAHAVESAMGMNVMDAYNGDPEVKRKILSREWDFFDVARNLLGKKEDKPVESNIERMLGVKKDEQFTILTKEDKHYKLGAICELMVWDEKSQTWHDENSYHFAEILNHPEYILRRPRLTDEQRKVMEALAVLGFKWVAKDMRGGLWAYGKKPERTVSAWQPWDDCQVMKLPNTEITTPLIPDWTQPLDIDKTLREAGE